MERQNDPAQSIFTITIVQVLVGALLFVALLNNQRDLTFLALLVLVVIGSARLWTRMSAVGLHYNLTLDKRKVFPGEKLIVTFSAENAKLLPIWMEIRVPIGNLLHDPAGNTVLTRQTSLLWYERTQFQWELTAGKRGVYPIGPLECKTGDLFSFFSRRTLSDASHSLVVYPALVSPLPLELPKRDFFGVPRANSPVPDPIYILGTRDYQPGQPSKYVHWKASARHYRLQEKVFEATVREKVLLVVNVDSFARDQAEQEFERVLEMTASLAVQLDRQGHSIGLVTDGAVKGGGRTVVPVARNDRQISAILEILARLVMKSDRDLTLVLRRTLAREWGVSCVYCSHAENEVRSSGREYLSRRKTPVVDLLQ